MKSECSVIKEKMFSVASVISLFTTKYKINLSEHLLRVLIP